MRKIIILCSFMCVSFRTQALTITANSTERSDVAAAIASATYGDTVKIPAGSSTWTSGIGITKDIKIIGAGIDKTFLSLNFTNNETHDAFFNFTPDATARNNLKSLSDSHTFEVSGINFIGVSRMPNKFGVRILNANTPAIRRVIIHNCKFQNIHRAAQVVGYIHGVFYSNSLLNTNGSYPQGNGSYSFANDRMHLGSGDGWYIEDNNFVWGNNNPGIVCGAGNDGGGFVVRYNTVTGTMPGSETYIENHGNQTQSIFAGQITEVYGNNMTLTGVGSVSNVRGSKNIYMFNLFACNQITLQEEFSDAQTSTSNPANRCLEPGQGMGRQNCTDDCICQKVHESYFFNNRYNTLTGSIINAYVELDYLNFDKSILNDPPEIVENIEFFNQKIPFDGMSGVGCGTLASRPTTCTPGVGYWATDQSTTDLTNMVGANPTTPISGVLYKCIAPNVWTEWYRPYTYPHPLRLIDDNIAPSVPSNVSAVIVNATQVNLTWTASADNVGVAGYQIFRNSTQIATSTNPNYSDTGLTPNTQYSYTVAAYDAAGNVSPQSSAVVVTTPASNHIPVISPILIITKFEGELVTQDIMVTDADAGNTITLTATGLPTNATLTKTGDRAWRFSWQTDFTSSGSYTVTFTANDGTVNSNSVSMSIIVNNVSADLGLTNKPEWIKNN